MTQWFFGPALIDRTFILTGGICEQDTDIATGVACKAIGGSWRGGHDLSGHVFLLVLSSAFLWMEVLLVALRAEGVWEEKVSATETAGSGITDAGPETLIRDMRQQDQGNSRAGFRVAAGVATLSWWMLLMTAAYFHTWFEKVRACYLRFIMSFLSVP